MAIVSPCAGVTVVRRVGCGAAGLPACPAAPDCWSYNLVPDPHLQDHVPFVAAYGFGTNSTWGTTVRSPLT